MDWLGADRNGITVTVLICLLGVAAIVVAACLSRVGAAVRRARGHSRSTIAEIERGLGPARDSPDLVRTVQAGQAGLGEWIDDRLGLLESVPELFDLQRRRPSSAQSVIRVLRDAAVQEERSGGLPARFLGLETASFASLLSGLDAGRAAQPGEASGWKLALAEVCGRSIDTVGLLDADPGEPSRVVRPRAEDSDGPHLRFLEARRRAVEDRRVKARELLVLSDGRLAADLAFLRLCEQLSRTGIRVRYLARDEGRADLLRGIDEFTLFDREISYQTVYSPSSTPVRPVVARTELVVERAAVERRVRMYAELWSAARPVADL